MFSWMIRCFEFRGGGQRTKLVSFLLFVAEDIDECKTDKHRCNQICRNTIGWYECACVSGFRLDSDNVTCVGTYYKNSLFPKEL